MLFALDGKPETYQEWAEEYFEIDVALDVVRDIYKHTVLTQEMVQTLNPEMTIEKLAEDLEEIGYP